MPSSTHILFVFDIQIGNHSAYETDHADQYDPKSTRCNNICTFYFKTLFERIFDSFPVGGRQKKRISSVFYFQRVIFFCERELYENNFTSEEDSIGDWCRVASLVYHYFGVDVPGPTAAAYYIPQRKSADAGK